MPDVRQRLLHILDSVSSDYFEDLKPPEMVFKLMMEYINIHINYLQIMH